MRTLQADGLILEPLVEAHAAAMFELLCDPAIYEFENGPPASAEALAQRYRRLESRRSPDGREQWLNWVIRLPSGELAGYVQATVGADGRAWVAYELASRHWRQGIARRAVNAMMDELIARYQVTRLVAVFKTANFRSRGLLQRLGFCATPAPGQPAESCDTDESVMVRPGMIPVLDTPRLRLLPPSAACDALYQRFYTDAAASATYGGPLTPGAAWARLAADLGSWHLQGFGVWVIEQRETGALLGTCGFWQGRGWPRELTWWLLPEARGQGYALEASRAAVAHACRVFGWPAVETTMNDANTAARALVLRLGGEPIGRRSFPDGLERDLFRIPDTAP
ncbi:GNAT family N-acetyltransferase [Aquabacterium sp.]|uniref:GNAT family N-acetyltransferase n=1 Tax=Aquabacterium sp. TaxID=1872578 RepID=UPI003784B3A7